MLNFLPVRHPSVSLLYGKRAVQRIAVGGSQVAFPRTTAHEVELPQKLVDSLYDHIEDAEKTFHRGAYQPLKWKQFMELKLDAFHFMEAAQAGEAASRSALAGIDWFPKIMTLYSGQKSTMESKLLTQIVKPQFSYTVHGSVNAAMRK